MTTQTATKTKRAATHRGSCQVCGAIQKLPEGVLAKHGYTTRWKFFEGICSGAGHLPYEKATNLIAAAIVRAEDQRANLKAFRASLLKPPTEAKGWLKLYRRHGLRFNSYHWTQVEFAMDNYGPTPIPSYMDPDTKKLSRLPIYGVHSKDILDYVANANKHYAEGDVTKELAQVERYITWQQRRVDEWKECDLLPLEETDKQPVERTTAQ